MRKKILGCGVILFFGLLTGCSHNYLTTTHQTYQADQMAAIIKGQCPAKAHLSYTINHQSRLHALTNNKGSFVVSVPRSNEEQNVRLCSNYHGHKEFKSVKVKANRPVMTYAQFAQKYNYLHLEQSASSIPLIINNEMKNLSIAPQATLRVNVQNQQLMGLTLIYPLAHLKSKDQKMAMAQSIMRITTLTGANGPQILQQLNQETRRLRRGKTVLRTITSNGRQIQTSITNQALYVYLTHQ